MLRRNGQQGLPGFAGAWTMAGVNPSQLIEPRVLAAWNLDPESARPLGNGLINRTFIARDRAGCLRVLQQVNRLFPAKVNEDIEAVTAHLQARGLATPRLVRTLDGQLCLPAPDGAWRVLTHVPGRVLDRMENPAQARAAGALLARFHRALDDLEHTFRNVRPPIHQPSRRLAELEQALAAHPRHRLRRAAGALAEQVFAAAAALPALPDTPLRVMHGDPKISNLVFAADSDAAVCMLDLDTLGRMALPFELGDACRSWCSLSTEDDPRSRFSAELFAAALDGYGSVARGWWLPEEAQAAVDATATIQVELAARFCADSLNECYFGWNPALFATRGEQNLARAQGQLAVHRSLLAQRERLDALAASAG
ncbi:MAG TPA: phosphotransferase [Gammaproteobacteria bacterium]|nr:phosphotransferase [Gammaproteobacteria bacterium]